MFVYKTNIIYMSNASINIQLYLTKNIIFIAYKVICINGAGAVNKYHVIFEQYIIFGSLWHDIYGCNGYGDYVCYIYKPDVCLLANDSISIGSIV